MLYYNLFLKQMKRFKLSLCVFFCVSVFMYLTLSLSLSMYMRISFKKQRNFCYIYKHIYIYIFMLLLFCFLSWNRMGWRVEPFEIFKKEGWGRGAEGRGGGGLKGSQVLERGCWERGGGFFRVFRFLSKKETKIWNI